mmetsp:Transcript_40759/g.49637  ORF Transcript_40759/g.49637 Transcript_40759/m.49637 type:complete len:116 (+) Transcript_40759:783-1130(+)
MQQPLSGGQPLRMLSPVTTFRAINLPHTQRITMHKPALQYVSHGNKAPMRMGGKALGEKRFLKKAKRVPRCETVTVVYQHYKRGRAIGGEKVGTNASTDGIFPFGDLFGGYEGDT